MKPGKHQMSKERGQDLGWKVHDCAHLLFCTHTLCCRNRNVFIGYKLHRPNHLLHYVRFRARSTPKIVHKNLQQSTLLSFITISP